MKRGWKIRGFLNKYKFWFLGLTLLIVLCFSGYYLNYYFVSCPDKTCFEKAVLTCKKVSWIREDIQAAWKYDILKPIDKNSCEIRVKLLKLKQGTIDSENLQGKEMICDFMKSSTDFPEKDISRCHGILKEEMQDILIQRMHNYLLQNVGQIQEGFKGF